VGGGEGGEVGRGKGVRAGGARGAEKGEKKAVGRRKCAKRRKFDWGGDKGKKGKDEYENFKRRKAETTLKRTKNRRENHNSIHIQG